MEASLVADALREAIGTRGGQVRDVVFHTDHGSQYTSRATAQLCKAYGIRQSVGRTGVCWDNAAAESFLGTLKKELVNRNNYKNRYQARLSIRYWIEAWYNPRPGFTPRSGTSHRTNGRTTTTITRPHKPSVHHMGGTPVRWWECRPLRTTPPSSDRSRVAQLAEDVLVDEIRAIWRQSGGTYGSPRVCAELGRQGLVVNHKRVERLMKLHRMVGFVPHKRRVTTFADTAHRIPDLLGGDFGASEPDEAWVGDISYIRTRQGFLYVAFVLDLASRRVVGVSMAPHMKASLS